MRSALLCLSLLLTASPSWGQDTLGLLAPDTVVQSGLLKHILPRFSLKTGIRVTFDAEGPIVIAEEAPGDPVFKQEDTIFFLRVSSDPRQQRFRDWLLSDVGKRTIESFQPAEAPPFLAHFEASETDTTPTFAGDTARGEKLSLTHCGRCHVIGPQNRMNGLGSTPSFAVLRTLPDWSDRFQQFYVLRPHGAFTQITGVTTPFDPDRPPPLVPVEITLDDLEAILAFVSATTAADLGAPLQLQ